MKRKPPSPISVLILGLVLCVVLFGTAYVVNKLVMINHQQIVADAELTKVIQKDIARSIGK